MEFDSENIEHTYQWNGKTGNYPGKKARKNRNTINVNNNNTDNEMTHVHIQGKNHIIETNENHNQRNRVYKYLY